MAKTPIEFYTSKGWYVTSGFGMRTCPFCLGKGCSKCAGAGRKFHKGIDFGGKQIGDPVHAPYPGTVTAGGYEAGGAGNYVAVRLDEATVIQLFFHLHTRKVNVGAKVKTGDAIGTNGATGNVTGAHLHYELREDSGRATGGASFDPTHFKPCSDTFSAGTKVKVTAPLLNVRAEPGTAAKVIGQLPHDSTAIIKQHSKNGIFATGYNWWHIGDGWLAENYLEAVEEGCPECARLRDENARLSTVLEEAERMITNAKRELGC